VTGSAPGVVVVGTGFGTRVHVPAARAAGFAVLGVVGRDPERATRRAARAGVDRAFTSLTEALASPGADVVIVATPPDTHAELAEQVIAAGRHVLVEKPFTTSVADAERLVALAEEAGVVALVGHEFRFAPPRVTLRDALARGLVGSPRMATVLRHVSFAAPLDLAAPSWWWDRSRGGGWLGAAVSHVVDDLRTWLGEFAAVSAALPLVSGRDPESAEDAVSARFAMRNGCEGVLQDSASVWGDDFQMARVAGPSGTLTLTGTEVTFADAGGLQTLPPAGPPLPVVAAPSDDPRLRFSHLELGPAIVQATVLRDLIEGRPLEPLLSPATFADGLRCMRVLDALRRSADLGGRSVDVATE
jgi:predicted dehydrogenase